MQASPDFLDIRRLQVEDAIEFEATSIDAEFFVLSTGSVFDLRLRGRSDLIPIDSPTIVRIQTLWRALFTPLRMHIHVIRYTRIATLLLVRRTFNLLCVRSENRSGSEGQFDEDAEG